MFASNVFALIMEQTVEVLDPGVVVLFALPYEKQLDPSNVSWLLAESVDDHLPTVPAKDIQSEVVLLLHSFYLLIPSKSSPSSVGYFPGCSVWCAAGNRAARRDQRKQSSSSSSVFI